ncbi:glycosyltransferase involved in cell wall biosynthesis [Pseudochelatococcus lubricantis]|uniref:Glycosyltransferase involved in cell wall biosynthesis n=1 Tax=Pseudochelatococcus lubricantis TaxID=1538102 RepID=A0ABX0V507_9HYPH|nr:glycosyltransferase family 4 protein [Pseudochelatococcus lubricantis]NIJ60303.1 glycosyltransferase involved in cell wall biosynthesis [Pseudochelatococcus lubricantis]
MDGSEHVLSCFTPLPPARNGIADYAYMLLAPLSQHFSCIAYTDEIFGNIPIGVSLRDERQAFRWLGEGDKILHQIGNNPGHGFVLDALRRYSGVVSLHDLNLLYLYEVTSPSLEAILARVGSSSSSISKVYSRQWKERGIKTAANYVLFDALDEVLRLSKGVIVHSKFALNKMRAVHGDNAIHNMAVIPHFAPSIEATSVAEARQRLCLDADDVIVLTSGFATKVKRFDWLMEALENALANGYKFRWIHAGPERPEEYALSQTVRSYPRLSSVTHITGYVSEAELDAYICASDLVVNLRFPSVGESSGTLARAFSVGKCCIVNDTAAYSELPRDTVVHLPVVGASVALERAICALIDNPDLRAAFATQARRFAQTELSLESVGARYANFINASYEETRQEGNVTQVQHVYGKNIDSMSPQTLKLERTTGGLSGSQLDQVRRLTGGFRISVAWPSSTDLSQYMTELDRFIDSIVPPHFAIRNIRFQWDVSEDDDAASGAERTTAKPISLIIDGFAH